MQYEYPSRRTIALGVTAGLVHAIGALWLGGVVRGRSALTIPETLSAGAVLAVTVIGLVVLGALPVILRAHADLVAPIVTLFVLFVGAFYASWHHFESARATGATPIGLYYDSLFGPLWIVPLALVVLVGVGEFVVRTQFSRVDRGSHE